VGVWARSDSRMGGYDVMTVSNRLRGASWLSGSLPALVVEAVVTAVEERSRAASVSQKRSVWLCCWVLMLPRSGGEDGGRWRRLANSEPTRQSCRTRRHRNMQKRHAGMKSGRLQRRRWMQTSGTGGWSESGRVCVCLCAVVD
jgi:hypothetical protein